MSAVARWNARIRRSAMIIYVTEPRTLVSTDSFVIKDRGTVYVTIEPDPLLVPGETILLDGTLVVVAGIERWAITPKPGRMIGVLVAR